MRKINLIFCICILHNICIAGYKCDIHYLFHHLGDSNVIKTIAHDENCLGILLDSMNDYVIKNENNDSVYRALNLIAHFTDGASSEVLSVGAFGIFLKKPLPFLKYMSSKKSPFLENILIAELCITATNHEAFKSKKEAEQFLISCNLKWKKGTRYINGLTRRLRNTDCN